MIETMVPKLVCSSVTKRFDGLTVLDGVSLVFEPGKITAITGPNGSGKSTLLNIISGFVSPDDGQIHFGGQNLRGLTPEQIAREGVLRTFQAAQTVQNLTVGDHLFLSTEKFRHLGLFSLIGGSLRGQWRASRFTPDEEVVKSLSIQDHRLDGRFSSFGQQKAIGLAMCLLGNSAVVLLDEPLAGVDSFGVHKIKECLKELRNRGRLIIIVEHNISALADIVDRVVLLAEGQVRSDGSPHDVLSGDEIIQAFS